MPVFKRLYIETSILRSSHWPSVSARLAAIVELARNFEVRVLIPQPVEDEREAQWLRDVKKASSAVSKAHKELSAQLFAVGTSVDKPEKPDLDGLREKYRAAAAQSRKRLGIELSPMTTKTAAELFPFAIRHEPPFQETGNHVTGFQDAVIFLSAIEDTRHSGESVCALFSEDKDFAEVTQVAGAEGIVFQYFRSYRDMWEVFVGEIKPALSEWWSADRQTARDAIESNMTAIEAHLLKETTPESVGALVKQTDAARITDVGTVETPLPPIPTFPGPYQRPPGSVVPITCTLRVSFDVRAIKLSSLFSRLVSQQQAPAEEPTEPEPDPEPQKEVISKSVELECKGTFNGKGYDLSEYRMVNLL